MLKSDPHDVVNIKQASKLLNVHPNTLRLWDKNNVLKSIRFGKRGDRNYRKEDVLELIKQKTLEKNIKNIDDHLSETILHFFEPYSQVDTENFIIKETKKLMNAKYGTMFLHQNNSLNRVYADCPLLTSKTIRPRGRTFRAFKTGKPFLSHVKCSKDIKPQILADEIRSIIFIPITYKDKTLGVLNMLIEQPRELTEKDLKSLQVLGESMFIALEKAKQYESMKRSLELHEQFLSYASHEFKNPLTSISLYGKIIKKAIAEETVPNKQIAENLTAESDRLKKLINELLDSCQIRKGRLKYTFTICSLQQILDRALIDFSSNHPTHNIHFQNKCTGANDKIVADFDKLLQVFLNLLNNAAKFSPEKKRIILTVEEPAHIFLLTSSIKELGYQQKIYQISLKNFTEEKIIKHQVWE